MVWDGERGGFFEERDRAVAQWFLRFGQAPNEIHLKSRCEFTDSLHPLLVFLHDMW